MRTQTTRTISGRIGGTGTLTLCTDPRVSAYRASQGVYAIVFPPDMRVVALTAVASGSWAGSFSATAEQYSPNIWTITMANPVPAGVDSPLNFNATVTA
jgi:hypothetical protein